LTTVRDLEFYTITVTTPMNYTGDDPVMVYAITNKEFGVREHEAYSLEEVLVIADRLNAAAGTFDKERKRPVLESVENARAH